MNCRFCGNKLTHEFIDLVNDYHPRARWYAQTVFNSEGASSPHNLWPFEPDPQQCVSVNKRQLAYMPWSYGIGTAGHMAHILWLHYEYSGNTVYLRDKIYKETGSRTKSNPTDFFTGKHMDSTCLNRRPYPA